jgi:hypothetical protein
MVPFDYGERATVALESERRPPAAERPGSARAESGVDKLASSMLRSAASTSALAASEIATSAEDVLVQHGRDIAVRRRRQRVMSVW